MLSKEITLRRKTFYWVLFFAILGYIVLVSVVITSYCQNQQSKIHVKETKRQIDSAQIHLANMAILINQLKSDVDSHEQLVNRVTDKLDNGKIQYVNEKQHVEDQKDSIINKLNLLQASADSLILNLPTINIVNYE